MIKEIEKKLGIAKTESKVILALIAHLRRVLGIVIDIPGNRRRHPLEMDQADLLLCAASIRTLMFDDSPSPVLLDFIKKHELDLEIEVFETDLAMFFLRRWRHTRRGI